MLSYKVWKAGLKFKQKWYASEEDYKREYEKYCRIYNSQFNPEKLKKVDTEEIVF